MNQITVYCLKSNKTVLVKILQKNATMVTYQFLTGPYEGDVEETTRVQFNMVFEPRYRRV